MKLFKGISKALPVALAITMLFSVNVAAYNEIYVNGTEIEVEAINENGSILVPVRGVFENLGYKIDYNAETKTATLKGEKTIVITNGKDYFLCDEQLYRPAVPQKIVNSRFYIPLRAVAEVLGAEVNWDGAAKSVSITTNERQNVTQNNNYENNQHIQDNSGYSQSTVESQIPEAPEEPAPSVSEMEKKVLEIANIERAKEGLEPLEWDESLAVAAHKHSEDMAQNGYFDHNNLDGLTPFDRMENEGADFMTMGENIAAGASSAEDTMIQWMNSPGHRSNILNPDFHYLGVGLAYSSESEYGYYWTQCFGGY